MPVIRAGDFADDRPSGPIEEMASPKAAHSTVTRPNQLKAS